MKNADPLAARLQQLAALRQTITYGALARDLGLRMADLTAALEMLMVQDAAQNLPLRAALLRGRLTGDLPALGFFEKATALGRYHGPPTGDVAAAFVQVERAGLFNAADAS